MVCIICALDIEYASIMKSFKVSKEYTPYDHCRISECVSPHIIIAKSEIGKESAESCGNYMISQYPQVNHIISVGIAGGVDPKIKIGDIVFANTIVDYKEKGDAVKIAAKKTCNEFYEKLKKEINNVYYKNKKAALHTGYVVSSDILVDDSRLAKALYEKHNGICVEMESAGVIKVCNENGIAFSAFKTISDYGNERAILSMFQTQSQLTKNLGTILSNIYK